jgi:hypothetical protein
VRTLLAALGSCGWFLTCWLCCAAGEDEKTQEDEGALDDTGVEQTVSAHRAGERPFPVAVDPARRSMPALLLSGVFDCVYRDGALVLSSRIPASPL